MKLTYAEKWVSQKKALEQLTQIGNEVGLSKKNIKSLRDYLLLIPPNNEGEIRLDHIHGLWKNFQRALEEGDAAFLEHRRGYKVDRVVNVIEFAESKEFANQKRSLWKSTADNLWRIHHGTEGKGGSPPCVIVLGGAAGTGKSETTWLSAMYTRYLLGCMWNPHLEFETNPGSWVVFAIQAPKLEQAQDSLFDKLQFAIDSSPWFRENCPRRMDYNSELHWPDQRIMVMPLTGKFRAGEGKDVFWFAITEANSMPVHEKSKQLQDTSKDVLDVAVEMYTTLTNRVETRYSQTDGGFPGKGIIDSQRSHTGDFTSKMIERARSDPNILVIERALWEAKAHAYPPEEPRFLVECGDNLRPSRIIANRDLAIDPDSVIEVPERHRTRFEDDCEEALRVLAGKPTSAIGRFIPYPERITRAFEKFVERKGDLRLFKMETVNFHELFGKIGQDEAVDWDLLINQEYINSILDKTIKASVHVDMAVSGKGDAVGIGITRIVGSKVVEHGHLFNRDEGQLQEVENIRAPVYFTDAVLQVKARPGEQIDVNLLRDLIRELVRRGFNIAYGSADWLEAAAMLQAWAAMDILTDHVSVDKTPYAYYELRQAIADERWVCQPHSILDDELRNVKREMKGGRVFVNHPQNKTKDVADGAAGSIFTQSNTEAPEIYEQLEKQEETGALVSSVDSIFDDPRAKRRWRPSRSMGVLR